MSNWAEPHIAKLREGKVAVFCPKGRSMEPLIMSGQRVMVGTLAHRKPCDYLEIGDVVLVTLKGRTYLHLVKDIAGGKYLIGNNRGGINGWVSIEAIHGVRFG
jgi:hypothetical protein